MRDEGTATEEFEVTNENILIEIISRYRYLYEQERSVREYYHMKYESLREHYNEKMKECKKTCDLADEENEE